MHQNIGPLEGLLGLVITSTILIAIPGPTIMFLIGQTLSSGRRSAFHGVVGNAIGMYGVAIVCSLGLGALVMKSTNLLTVVRLTGALALLLIGLQYIFSKPAAAEPRGRAPPAAKGVRSITTGMIVGLTNPKSFIMFGTIVPSYLGQDASHATATLLAYALIPILLGILIDATWVMVAHSVSTRAVFDAARLRRVNLLGGVLIVGMALLLAWSAIPSIAPVRHT